MNDKFPEWFASAVEEKRFGVVFVDQRCLLGLLRFGRYVLRGVPDDAFVYTVLPRDGVGVPGIEFLLVHPSFEPVPVNMYAPRFGDAFFEIVR